MSWLEALARLLVLLPFDGWQLEQPRALPADLVTIADPSDPLAQSQLWGALYPEIPRGFLVETCLVESGCQRAIGVHDRDAHLGASAWRGVWQRHRVDHACAFYPDPESVDAAWFVNASTRGNHGLIAAYHVMLLGPCVPLDALDVPFFSAWAAAEKASRVCRAHRRCTRERLRCAWAHVPYGSRACRKVVQRFHARLAAFRRDRPDLDPRARVTIDDLRRKAHHGNE